MAMLPHMMEAAGVTEELKACDPMRWVGLMNSCPRSSVPRSSRTTRLHDRKALRW